MSRRRDAPVYFCTKGLPPQFCSVRKPAIWYAFYIIWCNAVMGKTNWRFIVDVNNRRNAAFPSTPHHIPSKKPLLNLNEIPRRHRGLWERSDFHKCHKITIVYSCQLSWISHRKSVEHYKLLHQIYLSIIPSSFAVKIRTPNVWINRCYQNPCAHCTHLSIRVMRKIWNIQHLRVRLLLSQMVWTCILCHFYSHCASFSIQQA